VRRTAFTVTVTVNPQPDYNSYNNNNFPTGICSGDLVAVGLDGQKKATSVLADSYNITIINPNGMTGAGGNAVVGNGQASNAIANDKLLWLVVIHLTFVVSALLLTVMDRLLGAGERH